MIRKTRTGIVILLVCFIILCSFYTVGFAENSEHFITVSYSGVGRRNTISVTLDDNWLLQPDNQYNHKLMQASFVLAAASFRKADVDLSMKDEDILDFFRQAGFESPKTYDFNKPTAFYTIGSAIAHKVVNGETIIAVAISGNNYQHEWLSNLKIDDNSRPAGFNSAANRVYARLINYINENKLKGPLRLWTAGFSRAAAVTNLFAANAVDSGLFQAEYVYTFATPRTTKESNPERYKNIFNIINPFDVVPMIPFPEWGFARYGTDLFLPAIETDSLGGDKFLSAYEFSLLDNGESMIINPQINRELHTIFDYIAFFINSSASYMNTFQDAIINFWTNKEFKTLVKDVMERMSLSSIRDRLIKHDKNIRYRLSEFYNFLDYITQVIYTSFIGTKMHSGNQYWDSSLPLQLNIAHNHYESTYRYWLFSSDDPDYLLSQTGKYVHYTVSGNVDLEIYDKNGDFVELITSKGNILVTPEDSINPDFQGGCSKTSLYAERMGNQTLIVIPTDQKFTILIRSNVEQDIRVSYVEFSVDKLKADVCYIYYDHYAAGESFPEEIDPAIDRNLSKEELQKMGVLVTEPWSNDIVYSPTAVMRLENHGVFHPSPLFLLIFLFVIVIICMIVVVRILWITAKFVRRGIRKRRYLQ